MLKDHRLTKILFSSSILRSTQAHTPAPSRPHHHVAAWAGICDQRNIRALVGFMKSSLIPFTRAADEVK